jgi:hypothetical protein
LRLRVEVRVPKQGLFVLVLPLLEDLVPVVRLGAEPLLLELALESEQLVEEVGSDLQVGSAAMQVLEGLVERPSESGLVLRSHTFS